MRITIQIDDQLLVDARVRAARSGLTLSSVVEDALREAFARRSDATRTPVQLPTFAGSQLRPGVDLDESVALLDRVEGTNP